MSDEEEINGNPNDESDDEIEVTAKEVYEKLNEAWLNEKFSPELLDSRIELVECMLTQVKEIEASFTSKDKSLVSSLQKIELERVKFIISSYLRERLRKIENSVEYVLDKDSKAETSILSPGELKFAKEFAGSLQNHFNQLALQHMPSNMHTVDKTTNIPRPNPDEYVFMLVNDKQDQVLIDPEEEPFDLEAGSQHIVRYRPIAGFVENGSVSLI